MRSKERKREVARAVRTFLSALQVSNRSDLSGTPDRVAAMWLDQLLAGEGADLGSILGAGIPAPSRDAVSLMDVSVHLVCPHHLTVAFGKAHVAYLPSERVVAFGRLVDLVSACTSRLILQEACGSLVVDALMEHLHAKAAVCAIEATHPCHNVSKAKAHHSRVLTWAVGGPARHTRALKQLVLAGIKAS